MIVLDDAHAQQCRQVALAKERLLSQVPLISRAARATGRNVVPSKQGAKTVTIPVYSDKGSSYFAHSRQEIAPLLPENCTRILEVGCGNGATLRWLKTLYPRAETVGIEYEASNAELLASSTDRFFIADAETFTENIGEFDLILCLDVLEHLRSPEDALRRYVKMLGPAGRVIISVPAVSYIRISLALLLRRQFTYRDSGILDRTHTRLFVEDTAIKLANDGGLVVRDGLLAGLQGPRTLRFNRLTFGLFRHYLTKQYIVLGTRSDKPQPERVRWRIAKYPAKVAPADDS